MQTLEQKNTNTRTKPSITNCRATHNVNKHRGSKYFLCNTGLSAHLGSSNEWPLGRKQLILAWSGGRRS